MSSLDPLFAAGELSELRAISDASLPHECVVSRMTRTRRDGGGITETPVEIASIRCRVSASAPAQVATLTAEQLQALGRWIVVVGIDAPPILEGDTLVCAGADSGGNTWTRTLRVVKERGPHTYEVLRKIVAVDVGAGGA